MMSARHKIVAEHRLLAEAFNWLSRFPTMPERFLNTDRSASVGRCSHRPRWSRRLDTFKNASEFWVSLSIAPRPFFNLVVTITMDLDQALEEFPVTTAMANYHPGDPARGEWRVAIGGTVRDRGARPVAEAWVRLEPAGLTTVTDASGRFVFDDVARGAGLTLRARAPGFTEASLPKFRDSVASRATTTCNSPTDSEETSFMAVQVSYPGVYIDEFQPASPIQGASTSVAAFLGAECLRPAEQADAHHELGRVPRSSTHCRRRRRPRTMTICGTRFAASSRMADETCLRDCGDQCQRRMVDLNDEASTPQPSVRITARRLGAINPTLQVQSAGKSRGHRRACLRRRGSGHGGCVDGCERHSRREPWTVPRGR